jgi:hypothetical protein
MHPRSAAKALALTLVASCIALASPVLASTRSYGYCWSHPDEARRVKSAIVPIDYPETQDPKGDPLAFARFAKSFAEDFQRAAGLKIRPVCSMYPDLATSQIVHDADPDFDTGYGGPNTQIRTAPTASPAQVLRPSGGSLVIEDKQSPAAPGWDEKQREQLRKDAEARAKSVALTAASDAKVKADVAEAIRKLKAKGRAQ